MNIREFSYNLEKLYKEMSFEFSTFQNQTKINCPPSCGKCCFNPDVESTELEMMPLALYLYDQKKAEEWLLKLESSDKNFCQILVPNENQGEGYCRFYDYRPSVCRMFGVAGTTNKNQETILSICKYLKNDFEISLELKETAPLIPQWSQRLSSLHPKLTQDKLPINLALIKAIERILFYAQYQEL